MNNAKKMVLISPDVLNRLSNPIKDNTLNTIENDMSNILQSHDLDDRNKWAQYQQLLQRRQHFQDQHRQPVEIPIIETPSSTRNNEVFQTEILGTLPKALKTKGELLFKRLCDSDIITWDSCGRVSINNSVIPGSNITDLVCDVVRFKKSGCPTGWKQFSEALTTLNIPQEFIGNPQRRQNQPIAPSTASPSSPVPSSPRPIFPTMTARRRRRITPPQRLATGLIRWRHLH